jgi:hypothetical protein
VSNLDVSCAKQSDSNAAGLVFGDHEGTKVIYVDNWQSIALLPLGLRSALAKAVDDDLLTVNSDNGFGRRTNAFQE